MTRRLRPFALDPAPDAAFPPAELALTEPDGLLAVGGDLSPVRLLNAYAGGIFPWFSEGEPILWWSPNPRTVFHTAQFGLSRRLRRELRKSRWTVRCDTAFSSVVRACATAPRPGQSGTWITSQMHDAYCQLHALGYAHSVEVWDGTALVGGIYGVAIGQMFFGESMFSHASGGSKVALGALCRTLNRWGWPLLDAQVENPHLRSLGAAQIERSTFLDVVYKQVRQTGTAGSWQHLFDEMPASALADTERD